MRNRNTILFAFVILSCHPSVTAQTNPDTIIGRPRSVREKLIFQDSIIQNQKFWSIEGEYGHYGFRSGEIASRQFWSAWHHMPFVHYVNYLKLYSEDGQLIEEQWFEKTGKLLYRYQYKYDTSGHRIFEKNIFRGSSFSITLYQYNYLNQLKTKLKYFTFNAHYYNFSLNNYNSSGLLKEVKNFTAEGETYGRNYVYNEDNKLIRELEHSPCRWLKINDTLDCVDDEMGTDRLYKEYGYDPAGRMVLENHYETELNRDLYLAERTIFKYDPLGRIAAIESGRDTVIAIKKFFYNEAGQLIQELHGTARDPSAFHQIDYYYENGNIARVHYRDKYDDSQIRFTYQFDKKGNWTKQTKSIDGRLLFVLEREIQYSE